MKLKLSFFLLIIVSNLALLHAQIPSKLIEFDNEVWNFGEIDEAKGAIVHTYIFTNKSNQDFIIKNVEASCGCTTPEWSKNPIRPGGKGYIKATFNPTGMVGEAHKSVLVTGNFQDQMVKVLEIKGNIISYRFGNTTYVAGQVGYLRMSDDKFDFGNINKSKTDTTFVTIENDGTETFHILEFYDVPDYLSVWVADSSIAPGATAKVFAAVNGKKINDWGTLRHTVKIKTDDKFFFIKEAFVEGELYDDFTQLSKRQRKNAPHIQLSSNMVDFGSLKTGVKVVTQLKITNTGKSPLKIYKTYAMCSCTVLSDYKNELAPGETITVDVEFDTLFKSGRQTKSITFFTNDPDKPATDFIIQAVVTEHN